MKAMIFAAGLGTRLKPLTDHTPKALLPINGKPMLEHVILKLKDAGFNQIAINIHHLGHQIIDFLQANNNFGIETQLLGRNIGAGFCAAVKEGDFAETVETVEKLMHILGLDKDYQLISRYENLGVYAIIRK